MEMYQEFRKSVLINDGKRDKGLEIPEDIIFYSDICYGNLSSFQTLDIFIPKDDKKTHPVIMSCHGGGWVAGDKLSYKYYCASLAQYGFVVVSYNYRLAPEYKFPASLIDTNNVVEFIINNKDKYGIDINNFFAVGDSAGANLLSLYCCLLTNNEYKKLINIETADIKIKAVGLNCGKYDLLDIKTKEPNQEQLMNYLLGDTSDSSVLKVNTVSFVNEKFPPTYLVSSNKDFLLNQQPFMEKVLKEKNIDYIYKVYGDSLHQMYHVFHVDVKNKIANICNKETIDFFKKYTD